MKKIKLKIIKENSCEGLKKITAQATDPPDITRNRNRKKLIFKGDETRYWTKRIPVRADKSAMTNQGRKSILSLTSIVLDVILKFKIILMVNESNSKPSVERIKYSYEIFFWLGVSHVKIIILRHDKSQKPTSPNSKPGMCVGSVSEK